MAKKQPVRKGDPRPAAKGPQAGAPRPDGAARVAAGRTAAAVRERSRRAWRKPPAPKLPPERLSRAELLALAEARGIKYRTRMSKSELLAALGFGPQPEAPPAAAPPPPPPPPQPAPQPRNGWANPWEPPREQIFLDRGQHVPDHYCRDIIELMVRDPRNLFAYWDLAGGGAARIPQVGHWVLRLHDVDSETRADYGVDPGARNWYLPAEPDTAYRVEIGRLGPNGEFYAVAASRTVLTPRVGVSENVEAEWMQPDELRQLFQLWMGAALSGGPVPGSPRHVPWSGRGGAPLWQGMFSGAVSSVRGSWPFPSSWVTSRAAGSWPSSWSSAMGGAWPAWQGWQPLAKSAPPPQVPGVAPAPPPPPAVLKPPPKAAAAARARAARPRHRKVALAK